MALSYFARLGREAMDGGGFVSDESNPGFDDVLVDAQFDDADAKTILAGGTLNPDEAPGTSTNSKVLKLLVEFGHLDEKHIRDGKRLTLPNEIISDKNFKRLCRLIERADAEHASRFLRGLKSGEHPNVRDEFFRPMLAPGAQLADLFAQVPSHCHAAL